LIKIFFILVLLFNFSFSIQSFEKWGFISGYELKKYKKTIYKVELKNKEVRYYISLRFLAEDYDNISKDIKNIYVSDFKTKELIDIKDAVFVINSKTKGIFSRFSKLAFANKNEALRHIKRYKGEIRDFDFVLYLASRDIEEDKKYFLKKLKKVFVRGEKIYNTLCKNILESQNFNNIIATKEYLLSKCSRLNEKNLQALAVYIQNKDFIKIEKIEHIFVPKHEKCPVCGMIVSKYPKWTVQVEFENGENKYFDGVKDFYKFYFNPNKFFSKQKVGDIKNIFVTDFYQIKKIDAKKSFYVINSNVYGPMGHELIPFESLESAKKFKKDHFAKKIIKFSEVNEQLVYGLDEL
jgi:nitrous oxide reductase accessory protein NosL